MHDLLAVIEVDNFLVAVNISTGFVFLVFVQVVRHWTTMEMCTKVFHLCEICGCHIGVDEDTSILGYCAILTGK